MEELIFFVILIILSLVRSIADRRQPARPRPAVMPPERPAQEWPQPPETVVLRKTGEIHEQRELLLKQHLPPLFKDSAVEPSVVETFMQAAPAAVTIEEEEEALFQLDRHTVLLGLVFSEIINKPRSRHRQVRPLNFYH